MKRKALTDISVRHAKPKILANGAMDRNEIPDLGCKGLYLAVQTSGSRGFCHRYRYAGKTRRDVLGTWPTLTLAEARVQVTQARAALAKGIDPKPKVELKPGPAVVGETFAEIATRHWEIKAKKGVRSAARSLRDLERLAFPELGNRPIAEIKKSDVARVLGGIAHKQGFRTHDKVSADIRQVMIEHSLRSDDYVCPLVKGIRLLSAKESARKRILSDEELRAVVLAAEKNGLFGAYVRFLLLTGCRRNEAALMTKSELSDAGVWTLPAARSKTKEVVVRPLSRAALAILAGLPAHDSELVFYATEGRPLHKSFFDRKAKFDKMAGVAGWVLHDCRRAARSLMSRAGVPVDHCERALGHSLPGIRATYDLHTYQSEILACVEALAGLIERIVRPPGNNVVELERRA
jgi:integrase